MMRVGNAQLISEIWCGFLELQPRYPPPPEPDPEELGLDDMLLDAALDMLPSSTTRMTTINRPVSMVVGGSGLLLPICV